MQVQSTTHISKLDKVNWVLDETKKRKVNLTDELPLTAVQKARLGISYLALTIWGLIILTPFISLILASFDVQNVQFIYFVLDNYVWSFDNYIEVFTNTNFGLWIGNSLLISFVTMLITVVVVSLTGYAYSRFAFKGKHVSIMTILLVQLIPSSAAIVAYLVIHEMLASFQFPAWVILVLIYSAGNITGNTFIVKSYIDGISREIDDAGRIDGCGSVKLYYRIIMPLAAPILFVTALGSFTMPFNDVLLPTLLLTDSASWTIPLGLNSFLRADTLGLIHQPWYAAGSVVTSIPIVTLFLIGQRYMTSGLTAGGVKG